MRSSASKEQSEHTSSTSISTAQGPPPSVSTPPAASTPLTAEPLPSPISETHATMQASECASSSQTFYGLTHMCGTTNIRDRVWEEIWRRYDFSDHERARDVRLRKIKKLYWGYKIKLHRGWLKH
ncbi:hypothetical protein COCNU_09G001030 [Cocos nucifera]|uniref:Uncharacterized protein n=1 Tax=Cocos nucifera TaxID=13894 RepID=A0A8K0IKK3_COCNU|nr:hypothetical protein COCNU_09G001030 [Cocos nucifera]